MCRARDWHSTIGRPDMRLSSTSLFVTLLAFAALGEVEAQGQPSIPALPAGIRLLHTITTPKALPGGLVVFADQGRLLISASVRGVHAHDAKTGELRHTWPGTFRSLAVSADGVTLAAIDAQLQVYLFDVASRRERW